MRTTHFIAQARTTCVATALLCLLYCLMFSSPLEPVYTSPPDEEDSDDRLFPHMFFPRPPPYSTPIQPPPYSTPIKPPSHDQGHVHGVYHGSKDVDEKPRQHTRDARARDDIVPGRFFDNNKHIAQANTRDASKSKSDPWMLVDAAHLQSTQPVVFKRYALTGFRNKASTDLEILGRALAAMFDSYHHESYCAVFDVGANIGKYVLDLRTMKAIDSCHIFAYEPNPEAFDIMKRTVSHKPRVHPTLAGVSNKTGKLTIRYRSATDTGAGFRDTAIGGKEAVVDVTTVDHEVARLPAEAPVALLKIDVEGLEGEVLQGSHTALQAGRIQMLYWERKGAMALQGKIQSMEDEVNEVASYGYKVFITGCIPRSTHPTERFHKHRCRLALVRCDGEFWNDTFDPARHRDGANGKFSTINLLALNNKHPYMKEVAQSLLVTSSPAMHIAGPAR